jgi:uncharacterized protein (DUF488 family)
MSPNSPTEKPAQIFTLGYGNRAPEQLFDLVKSNGCGYLIDVRSMPYSKYHKEYNRETLEQTAAEYGVKYLYLGDQLGGKPSEDELDELGRPDYIHMAEKPSFEQGLDRLIKARELGIPVVLLCAELRPETCHRTRLIGASLSERAVELVHIDEDENLLTQSEVSQRLDSGQDDLFS